MTLRHHAKLKSHPPHVCKNATAGNDTRPQHVNTEFIFSMFSPNSLPSLQLGLLCLSFPVVTLQFIRSILSNVFNEVVQLTPVTTTRTSLPFLSCCNPSVVRSILSNVF